MSLVVCTPDSLELAEEKIRAIFTPIENKNLEPQSFKNEIFPYPAEKNGKLVKVVPVKEIDELLLTFTIPPQYQHQKHKTLNYFGHLYGHESEGSILNLLVEEGLATDLSAGAHDTEDYLTEMDVTVSLTKKGLAEYEKVISVIGAYTNMLLQQGPQEWVWNEVKDVAYLGFEYPEKSAGASMCVSYASKLAQAVAQQSDLKNFIYDMKTVGEFKPEVIDEVTRLLTIDNAQVYLFSKDFEGKVDSTEYYFKTNYAIEELQESLKKAYTSGDLSWKESSASIHLPEKNTLIPTDFSLLQGNPMSVEKIRSDEWSEVFFHQDSQFKLPKCTVACQIYNGNPEGENKDLFHVALRELWIKCFNDSIRSLNYLASMAKVNFSFSGTYRNLQVIGKCYSQSVAPAFEMFSQSLRKFRQFDDERKFTDAKLKMIKDYKNKLVEAPFRKAFGVLTQILINGKFSYEEYIQAFEKITWQDFKNFEKNFLNIVRFEWLIEGNMEAATAVKITEDFESQFKDIFKPEALPKTHITKLEPIKITGEKHLFIEKDIQVAEENNSCYVQVFQIGQGFETFGLANWLAAWLKDEYFEELRTN